MLEEQRGSHERELSSMAFQVGALDGLRKFAPTAARQRSLSSAKFVRRAGIHVLAELSDGVPVRPLRGGGAGWQDPSTKPPTEPRQIGGLVDIIQYVDVGDLHSLEIDKRIGKRVRAGPAHVLKRTWHARKPLQSHEPIPSIRRRTEDRVMISERAKGGAYVGSPNPWNIGADDNRWPRRQLVHHALHAGSEIAVALRNAISAMGKGAARDARVRSNCETCSPFGGLRDARQYGCQRVPIKGSRARDADLACKTRLHPPRARLFHHDDEVVVRSFF